MKKEKLIIKIPHNFMNTEVTVCGYFISYTNDSAKWGTINYKLPDGNWSIFTTRNERFQNTIILHKDTEDEPKPYIQVIEVGMGGEYNPDFGDDKECVCGHVYYRHFDSYEDMENVGCKYCRCHDFKEKKKDE